MPRKLILFLIVSCLFCLSLYSQDNNATTVQALGENLYAITGLDQGNAAFLVTEKGVLVVDAGAIGFGGRTIVQEIAKKTTQPIRFVILTHHHFDHTGGLQAFPSTAIVVAQEQLPAMYQKRVVERVPEYVEQTNAEIADLQKKSAEEKKPEELAKLKQNIRQDQDFLKELQTFKPVYPEITFNERLAIVLGQEKVEIFFPGPGHTNDNSVVYFPRQKVVHAGDLIFNGSYPYIMRKSGANTEGWIADLNEILKLDAGKVIPGHGAIGDKEIVKQQIAYLSDLRSAVAEAAAKGTTLEVLKKSISLPAWKRLGSPEMLPANVEAVYSEMTEAAKK